MRQANRQKEQRQGMRLLSRKYAQESAAGQAALPAGQIVAYREGVLDAIEQRLTTIRESIETYDPHPEQRRGILFRLVADIAGEILQADDLFRALAEVEELQPKGG